MGPKLLARYEPDDLVQDALLRMMRFNAKLDSTRSFLCWLRRAIVDRIREKSARSSFVEPLEDLQRLAPPVSKRFRCVLEDLGIHLGRLDTLIVRLTSRDYSAVETARRLGLLPDAVRQRMARLRRRLASRVRLVLRLIAPPLTRGEDGSPANE
ncbi:MAG: sigma-70 family RNA polymerase sigma factor [Planctomycetes bacterium]|nr:sigma-70 family RNA polymerase sigma factor [Planctomycetota bacterium]